MTKSDEIVDLCVGSLEDARLNILNRIIEVKAIQSLVTSDPDSYCKSSKLSIIRGELESLDSLLSIINESIGEIGEADDE